MHARGEQNKNLEKYLNGNLSQLVTSKLFKRNFKDDGENLINCKNDISIEKDNTKLPKQEILSTTGKSRFNF